MTTARSNRYISKYFLTRSVRKLTELCISIANTAENDKETIPLEKAKFPGSNCRSWAYWS